MRRRKRNPFVKAGVLCLALVLGLGAMGVGYAHWTDTLTIGGTVGTGEWELGGTPGFWKNWDSHNTYTENEIEGWLATIDSSSLWLDATTVEGMEAIFDDGEGGSPKSKFLRAYLATRLDVASGRLNTSTVHNVTGISGYGYLGLATPASATLTDIIVAIEDKEDTPPPSGPEYLIMKDVCDALNNLLI